MFLRSSSKSGVGQGWRPHQSDAQSSETRSTQARFDRESQRASAAAFRAKKADPSLVDVASAPKGRILPRLVPDESLRRTLQDAAPTHTESDHLLGRQSDRRCGRQREGIKHPNRRGGTRDSRLTKTRRWLRARRPRHTKRPARNQLTGAFAKGAERKGKAKTQDHDLSRQRQGEAFA